MPNQASPPLVSVIVRSMNRATLAEALGSIALQTYPNIEVIVVNALGAGHRELGHECGRFRLRLLNQQPRPLGRSEAANIGLDAVHGEFFAFLDDDDTFDADHFARLVACQQSAQELEVHYAAVRSCDRQDSSGTVLNIFAEHWEEGKLLAGNFIPIHAPLVPSVLLAKGVRFDTTFSVYEDWDFWLQLSQYARFVLCADISATYFVAGGSGVNPLSVDAETMHQATLAIYAKWLIRLGSEALWQVARLYHGRNLNLHNCYSRCGTLENELGTLGETLAIVRYDLDTVRSQLDLTHREMNRVCAELDDVYNSRSWRITTPLRALSNFLRRS